MGQVTDEQRSQGGRGPAKTGSYSCAGPKQATQATDEAVAESADAFRKTFAAIKAEVHKFIVGHEDTVEHVLTAAVCGGHVLLEGVPGLGKTVLVTTLSRALDLSFKRIQFTPDLLPSDVVGTDILVQRGDDKVFEFREGPVFCNILLADEINRATPKTQSALLETMSECSVTVSGTRHLLPAPFFVLATQNPIEQDGTYSLPEAQLDRFFFKLHVEQPDHAGFVEILRRTAGVHEPEINAVASGEDLIRMANFVRQVPIAADIEDYLVRIVRGTHPTTEHAPDEVRRFVRHGASPRAAQTMLHASRVRALVDGRYHVAREDVAAVAIPAMRHRLILSFEGEAEDLSRDDIIRSVVAAVS